jgi:hypothetical protein
MLGMNSKGVLKLIRNIMLCKLFEIVNVDHFNNICNVGEKPKMEWVSISDRHHSPKGACFIKADLHALRLICFDRITFGGFSCFTSVQLAAENVFEELSNSIFKDDMIKMGFSK